jgi:hypothetical protein
MRLEAFDLPDSIVLKFGTDSLSLRKSEVKRLGLQDTCLLLIDKIEKMAKLRDVEIVEPTVEEFELDGDEDDEDISLYEDVIETPYSYLSDRGII